MLLSLINSIGAKTAETSRIRVRTLSPLFRLIGMSRVVLESTSAAMLVPIGAISLSFFVFAYLVSRRVKKTAVRELVVE